MITAILMILWLTSCALCTGAGFWLGRRSRRPKAAAQREPSAQERRRFERELREMENFFAYDGSEQAEPMHPRSV